ncbi:hypothetical protein ABIE67_010055 [Streptomyces sp. V4I8]|uniref:daptide biosynthesis RiPP recognition protein n=1 Tax=Streptomyces sp. V4I8 TaxID=3156469 RepID=UPI0035120943
MEGILRRLNTWGRGSLGALPTPSDIIPERTILTESATLLPDLLDSDLCGHGTLVFCPSLDTPALTHGTIVVPYEGSLVTAGDEILLGQSLIVEVQEYAAAHELAIFGPTLVRMTSESDFHAFLYDADRAQQYGAFPLVLLDPMVQLCDLCVLGGTHACGGPRRRLYVTIAGDVKTTPLGTTLGTVEDCLASLTAGWSAYRRFAGYGCSVCLSETIPLTTVDAAHQQRPWLSRYLHALSALRAAAANGVTDLEVSGFAQRLIPALNRVGPAADLTRTASSTPLLLFNNDIMILHDPASQQQLQLGPNAARIIELLLVHGNHNAAAEAAIRHLKVAPHSAHTAVTQVTHRLTSIGINLLAASRTPGTGAASRPPERLGAGVNHVSFEDWLSRTPVQNTPVVPRIPRPKSG